MILYIILFLIIVFIFLNKYKKNTKIKQKDKIKVKKYELLIKERFIHENSVIKARILYSIYSLEKDIVNFKNKINLLKKIKSKKSKKSIKLLKSKIKLRKENLKKIENLLVMDIAKDYSIDSILEEIRILTKIKD